MAALEKSVRDAQEARGDHGPEDATVHEIKTKPAPAAKPKKAATKKAAPRARKTPPGSA